MEHITCVKQVVQSLRGILFLEEDQALLKLNIQLKNVDGRMSSYRMLMGNPSVDPSQRAIRNNQDAINHYNYYMR